MKHFKDQNDEIAAGNIDGISLDLKSLGVCPCIHPQNPHQSPSPRD